MTSKAENQFYNGKPSHFGAHMGSAVSRQTVIRNRECESIYSCRVTHTVRRPHLMVGKGLGKRQNKLIGQSSSIIWQLMSIRRSHRSITLAHHIAISHKYWVTAVKNTDDYCVMRYWRLKSCLKAAKSDRFVQIFEPQWLLKFRWIEWSHSSHACSI